MILKVGFIGENGNLRSYSYFEVCDDVTIYPAETKQTRIVNNDGYDYSLYRCIDGTWIESAIEYKRMFDLKDTGKDVYVNYIRFLDRSDKQYKVVVASEREVFIMNDNGKTVDRY